MRIINVNLIVHAELHLKTKLPETPNRIPRYNKVKQAEPVSFIILLIIELDRWQSKSCRTNMGKSSSTCHDHRGCAS